MKISICGKGGSGKSTIVAALANEFIRRGNGVKVIDTDESNSELYRALNLKSRPSPIMELAGGRKNVRQTLKGKDTRDIGGEDNSSILAKKSIRISDLPEMYFQSRNNLQMVVVGKIYRAMEGCACPMGVLSKEFLKRLALSENEIALVDMEAGIEHFGRGVETSIDCVVAVVEPSMESVNLAGKINSLALDSGAVYGGAIINKAVNEKTVEKIETELKKRKISVLGVMYFHNEFFEAALNGKPIPDTAAGKDIGNIADALLAFIEKSVATSENKKEDERILENKIADLKARMPAHSVNPSMVQELEELEEKLEKIREKT